MEIRFATLADLEVVASLFNQYRQFYQQPSDIDSCRRFLSERFQYRDSTVFLANDSDLGAVGFAQLYPSFSSISLGRSWILNDLFVVPASRGKNAGKRLVEKCQEFALTSDAKGLSLQTAVDNQPAQALYRSLGWAQETQFISFNFSLKANALDRF
jgi:GNAT superfamily N-acetyltransferase